MAKCPKCKKGTLIRYVDSEGEIYNTYLNILSTILIYGIAKYRCC